MIWRWFKILTYYCVLRIASVYTIRVQLCEGEAELPISCQVSTANMVLFLTYTRPQLSIFAGLFYSVFSLIQ